MAFRLIVVRHGETAWNRERRFQGRQDVPLSAEGQRQAEAVARTLAPELPAAVYTSPLGRARDTARAIAEPHGLPVTPEPAFVELAFGGWEGLTVAEVQRIFPELYARWRREPHTVRFPGGEDLEAAGARVRAALDELKALHANQAAIAVTHSVIVRLIVLGALALSSDRLWAVTAEPGGITEIEYGNGWTTVHRMNTRQHLEPILAP
jgi:broad specificity phosphatase PhoE